MPFDFPELIAALAPRPFFSNAPPHHESFAKTGPDDCMRAALPISTLLHAEGRLVSVHPYSSKYSRTFHVNPGVRVARELPA